MIWLLVGCLQVGLQIPPGRGSTIVYRYRSRLDSQKDDFGKLSWQTKPMTEENIKAKQALIQELRDVAEKETAWLEKNRLLYTEKRSRLDI